MENKIGIPVCLSAGQLSRLRDLVNDNQDRLFEKLGVNVKEGREARANGIRESLKFWDAIDVALRDAHGFALDVEQANQIGEASS